MSVATPPDSPSSLDQDPTLASAAPASRPHLGRFLALALATLFVMVALGVYWVWQRADREQQWRDRINATETMLVPRNTP